MLKNIFLDLDDTILNFTAGEAKALSQTLREAGIEPTEAILDRYHIINTAHWELLEEGRLTRDEVLVQRFEQLFRELGVDHSGKAISERYEVLLSCQHDFMPGAEQLLKDLSSRYDLYLASNGAAAVQNPRLDDAGLRTVWFNPHGKEPRPDIRPSYTIHALSELLPLLASIQ